MADKKTIVCLGGGIGTVNLVRGLKSLPVNITVVASMADEGGSSGRLRRLYNIQPPGDIVSCMAALSAYSDEPMGKLLTYRFPGDRYGADDTIGGQKLGNLMMVAATNITGNFNAAVSLLKDIFAVSGNIYPATDEPVSISAVTVEGTQVTGEENIDLGKYDGQRVLDRIMLHPENPKVQDAVIDAINVADTIVAGPGDLYTTILPALIIPKIKEALLASKAKKIFVVNVANKPFETKGYVVEDFSEAITKHLGSLPFQTVIANNNYTIPIPEKLQYTYVRLAENPSERPYELILSDLVDAAFPIYHDYHKLAKLMAEHI